MLDGLKRIINSAKVQLLAASAFGALMTYLMTPGSAAEKRGLLETMITALAALVGAVILGWAHEDAAGKSQPQNQTNVNSAVTNAPTVATPASEPPAQPEAPPPPKAPQHINVTLSAAQLDAIAERVQARIVAAKPVDHPKGA